MKKSFRGHRYAARSCRLLLPLAAAHGLKVVWLTVDPKNVPSQRTGKIIGARCCVNIVGSRGVKWDGPCRDDLTDETFGMIVEVVRDFIARLGPHIRSCHAKDVLLQERPTVHLDEVRPGKGVLDYPALLTGLAKLDGDIPLMLEHLPNADEYNMAAAYIRHVALNAGVPL